MKRLRNWLLVMTTGFMVGCEAVAPALTQLAVAFGQDLIAAASVNHAPRYATEMEALLIALTRQVTNMPMQATLAQSGYQRPPPGYMQQQQNQGYGNSTYGQSNSGYNNQGYQQNDPYAQPGNDPYAQQNDPYAQADDPYGEPGDPYGQANNDPYAQTDNEPYAQADDPYAQPNDPYAQPNDPYAQPNDPYAQTNDPYAQPNDPYAQPDNDPYARADDPYAQNGAGSPYQMRSMAPVELDVALMTQRAGTLGLVAIEDGDVLRDGGADPASGDLLKVHFRANCACYVYIIGVDATGYVAQIYPDPAENHANPVQPGQSYLIPSSQEDWWALDTYKGLEQVFFLASYQQRTDVEEILARMANIPRASQPQSYQPVAQAAVVPLTRGLIKVKAKPVNVPSAVGTSAVTPDLFQAPEAGAGVVVTRWFNHE